MDGSCGWCMSGMTPVWYETIGSARSNMSCEHLRMLRENGAYDELLVILYDCNRG